MTRDADAMVLVPGGRLHVVDEGAGAPVLLVHAGIVDLRAWDDLVPLLVARGFRAIRYDMRGHGRSETGEVEFSNRADIVAVLDACGVGRACLVGNSVGGQVALDTAIEHPDRAAALLTLGASVSGYEAPATPEEVALFEEMERLQEAGDPAAIVEFDLRLWVDGPGQPADRVPAALRERVREMSRGVADPSRMHGRPIPLRPPAAGRLADLQVPVLAMAGALDVSDVWATALHVQEACPDARAELVPGVAHMIAMEAPALVADRIAELVAGAGSFR
jgi:3-oxoadipate enol-lactonase